MPKYNCLKIPLTPAHRTQIWLVVGLLGAMPAAVFASTTDSNTPAAGVMLNAPDSSQVLVNTIQLDSSLPLLTSNTVQLLDASGQPVNSVTVIQPMIVNPNQTSSTQNTIVNVNPGPAQSSSAATIILSPELSTGECKSGVCWITRQPIAVPEIQPTPEAPPPRPARFASLGEARESGPSVAETTPERLPESQPVQLQEQSQSLEATSTAAPTPAVAPASEQKENPPASVAPPLAVSGSSTFENYAPVEPEIVTVTAPPVDQPDLPPLRQTPLWWQQLVSLVSRVLSFFKR